jgi:hypothetical protein
VWQGLLASDNVYADVDGDDLPDMIPARITARHAADLERMVGKLLAHERTPALHPGFYAHPVLAAGWDPVGWSVMETETLYGYLAQALGAEPAREYVAQSPGGVWPDSAWVATFGPAGLGYLPADPTYLTDWGGSAARINADINAGAFCALHRGHGSVTCWGDPLYTTADVAGLHNTSYPFVFSIDALTGDFTWGGECLTEALHRSAHGAVGMISSTGMPYTPVTRLLYLYLLDSLWPTFLPGGAVGDSELRPAFALAAAKYLLAADATPLHPQQKAATYHMFHHHGDALLVMNDRVPVPLDVEHEDFCLIGATHFTVRADAGALVGLTIDGEIIGVGTGTGTSEPIPIEPPSQEGTLRIVITKQDHLRYDATVPVRSGAGVSEGSGAGTAGLRLELASANPAVAALNVRFVIPAVPAGECCPGPAAGRATLMSLRVLDAQGRCVRTLAEGVATPGQHTAGWDGRGEDGVAVGAGLYFVRLGCGGSAVVKRFAYLQ